MEQDVLLSICVPTYKRKKLIVALIAEIIDQLCGFDSNDIELIVSVNPSDEKIENEIRPLMKKRKYELLVNSTNIGAVSNMLSAVNKARGKLVWIIGDDDMIVPGTIKRIITAIREHPDISWVYLNTARLTGDAENDDTKLCEAYANKIVDEGYYSNGKSELLKMFRQIDARILFSTSNIYLREALLEVYKADYAKKYNSKHDIFFQLTGTFYSATMGAAYVIPDTCIVEGESISWSDSSYYISVHAINDAVLVAADWGYSNKEVKSLVRHRLTNDALVTWVLIFKMIIKKPIVGLKDYIKYFKMYPFLSIFMVFGVWVWVPYLLLRKIIRNKRRADSLKELRQKNNLPQCIKCRL